MAMMKINYAGLSDPGLVRERNEDRWYASARQGLFLVTDGMGGEHAGALASKIVVEVLPPLLREGLRGIESLANPKAREHLLAAVAELSEKVRSESQGRPGLDGMGATVVLALIRRRQALIGHLGDSRAYLLRQGRLQQLTRDHSLVQSLIDCGELTPEQAAVHPGRGQLTRHIGMRGEALPEARWLELSAGDLLLLCSDGLSGPVSEVEMLRLFRQRLPLEITCQRLIEAALAAGGVDNITSLIVSCDGADP